MFQALASERAFDWQKKFAPYGFTCIEITADTADEIESMLPSADILVSTPEVISLAFCLSEATSRILDASGSELQGVFDVRYRNGTASLVMREKAA